MKPPPRPVVLLLGAVLAVTAIGLALQPLTAPAFTRVLVERYYMFDETGLRVSEGLRFAERARAYVTGSVEGLPRETGATRGFDDRAIEHLADVRHVLLGARWTTLGLCVLSALGLGLLWRWGGRRRLVEALRWAAIISAILPLFTGAVAFLWFDAFFVAFHSLFFEAGTWVFPADSLLIRLFPEPFWATAGAAWAALVVLWAGAYGVVSGLLGRLQGVGTERVSQSDVATRP